MAAAFSILGLQRVTLMTVMTMNMGCCLSSPIFLSSATDKEVHTPSLASSSSFNNQHRKRKHPTEAGCHQRIRDVPQTVLMPASIFAIVSSSICMSGWAAVA